jgi:hypothetical protein
MRNLRQSQRRDKRFGGGPAGLEFRTSPLSPRYRHLGREKNSRPRHKNAPLFPTPLFGIETLLLLLQLMMMTTTATATSTLQTWP